MNKEEVQMLFYSVSEHTLQNFGFSKEIFDKIVSYDDERYSKFCINTGLIPIGKVELLPNFTAYCETLEEEEKEDNNEI